MSPPESGGKGPLGDLGPGDVPAPDERAAFRPIGERPRFSGDRLKVVYGTFVGPNGFTFEREIVRTFAAVCVVPLESDREHVLLVRQYRGAVDQALLELPAGKLDVPGELPELCAARELAEEVGAVAGQLREIGRFYNSPGYSDELTFCYLAEELRDCARAADGIEEEHLTVERIALGSVEDLIEAGELADAKTIVGLLLARSLLDRPLPGSLPFG